MRQSRGAALGAAGDRASGHHQSDNSRKPSDSAVAADCTQNGRDGAGGGENSPIYHELDPVIVAAEPPLQSSSYHDYQTIVDVRRDLVQLRSSGSATLFDHSITATATTTTTTASTPCSVPQSPSCGDVTTTNDTSAVGGSCKWTLFSRLRLPRRTAAPPTTRQQQGAHAVSPSGRTALTSPPDSATATSGTSPSCHATSWWGETFTGVTRADYSYVSSDDVQRHLASIPAGVL